MTSKNGSESSVKKRVLLVDDEARVRASLKAVLEPAYEVIQAADARKASICSTKKRRMSSCSTSFFPEPTGCPFSRRCGRSRIRPPLSC